MEPNIQKCTPDHSQIAIQHTEQGLKRNARPHRQLARQPQRCCSRAPTYDAPTLPDSYTVSNLTRGSTPHQSSYPHSAPGRHGRMLMGASASPGCVRLSVTSLTLSPPPRRLAPPVRAAGAAVGGPDAARLVWPDVVRHHVPGRAPAIVERLRRPPCNTLEVGVLWVKVDERRESMLMVLSGSSISSRCILGLRNTPHEDHQPLGFGDRPNLMAAQGTTGTEHDKCLHMPGHHSGSSPLLSPA